MDWHEYVAGQLIEARLAEHRAAAARMRMIRALGRPRRSPRIVLALIRLGSRIAGAVTALARVGRARHAPS